MRFFGQATFATAGISTLVALTPLAAQAHPAYAHADHGINGRIRSFDGHYHLTVKDDRGYLDDVTLHEGTTIVPRGLTLGAGQRVHIRGYASGRTFIADEVDTPYISTPSYAYPVAAYPYPEPYYPAYPAYQTYPVYYPAPVYPVYPVYGPYYGYNAYPTWDATIIIGGGWHHGWRRW